jgi:hypothetical protein
MKRFLFLLAIVVLVCLKLFESSYSNRLSFHPTHYGDRIKASDFHYKKSTLNYKSTTRNYLSIFNLKTKKEYEVTFDLLYDDDFAASEVNESGHLFIVTSNHTSGSGGYDSHEVFKVEGDKLISLGNKMSCDRDVRKEGAKLIFTKCEYQCDDFFEVDGKTTISTIELK